ncbi:MAG: histidine phosphatase family protein [Rhodocyclaceae bacterium]
MLTRLCLVRHGETDWNVARRLQGFTDIPLNAEGLRQAHAAAAHLTQEGFEAIYSSDLQRARATADIIAKQVGLRVADDARLRERNFGVLQGMTPDEAAARYPDIQPRIRARDAELAPPEGESLAVFAERVRDGLDSIAGRHPGQTILVVAHGGVLDIAYRIATGKPLSEARDFALGNATLNWISWDGQGWALIAWDQRAHLDHNLDELPL